MWESFAEPIAMAIPIPIAIIPTICVVEQASRHDFDTDPDPDSDYPNPEMLGKRVLQKNSKLAPQMTQGTGDSSCGKTKKHKTGVLCFLRLGRRLFGVD